MQKPHIELIHNYDNYPFLYRHYIIDATMIDGGLINEQIEIGIRPVIFMYDRILDNSISIGVKIFGLAFQTRISW
jgi:hypothetical protein|tara:strand:+ start:913 stop:1137 length:225 start_codon:yes stop_codon:yes gene_type:complete